MKINLGVRVIGLCGLWLIIGVWLSGNAATALALPPRPTATAATAPTPPEPQEGSWIRLRYSAATLGAGLWSGVQWLDSAGQWQEVEGWQGVADGVVNEEAYKMWWVSPRDFGKGPFRWVVRGAAGGELLWTSDNFTLPRFAGEVLEVGASRGR